MNATRQRLLATALASAAVAGAVSAGVIAIWASARGANIGDASGLVAMALVGVAVLGALIIRRTGNPVGWIFVLLGGAIALSGLAGALLSLDQVQHVPGAEWLGWLNDAGFTSVLYLLPVLFLVFPDGRLPSPRWRWVAWTYGAGVVISTIWGITAPVSHEAPGGTTYPNPTHVAMPDAVRQLLVNVGGALALIGAFACILALILRYRRAEGELRLQMKWLVAVVTAGAVLLLASWFIEAGAAIVGRSIPDKVFGWIWIPLALLVAVGIPVSVTIAVLKYRLYDIDVVIRKTVVFGLLAAFITLVYAAIVSLVSLRFQGSTVGSFIAAATLAVLFAPARDRARKVADRLVYGKRATPYEVLAEFSDRVGESYAADDVLARMAQVLMEGTGASGARVLLRVGAEEREAAATGTRGDETFVEVTHQGEELGALAVSMPAADPMNPAKRKLVDDLAAQAGLVLRNVKLIEELKASRQRLVAAQDEERRRIERNIHDGAQQQLVALAVQLKLAGGLVGKDPEKERELLETLGARANEALEDLRDLARGIYPPVLADQGLVAALQAQARKAAVATTVDSDGVGRFSREVESTAYFCTLEALNNVAKYAEATQARIALAKSDGHLTFTVTDDGRGFDRAGTSYGTGLQGIADRLAALGGDVKIDSSPGMGTTVRGSIPIRPEDVSA